MTLDNLPIVFAGCDQLQCVDVAIDDDNRLEKTERVSIALERPEDLDNRIIIGYGTGEIIIIDDPTDGVCAYISCQYVFIYHVSVSSRGHCWLPGIEVQY